MAGGLNQPPLIPQENLENQPKMSGNISLPYKDAGKPPPPQMPQNLQGQPPIQQVEKAVVKGEPSFELANYCCVLGIPREISNEQVVSSLVEQKIEAPVKIELCKDGVIEYLKLCFSSDKTVKDLILQDTNVGITVDSLIYPILVLPCIKDKKITDLLVYHQVQLESSLALDGLFLNMFYNTYGPIVDVIDIKPTKHVIVFSQQLHAAQVLDNSTISLQKGDHNVILRACLVDECYPVLRKNLEANMITVMMVYLKSIFPLGTTTSQIYNLIQENRQKDRKLPSYLPVSQADSNDKMEEEKGKKVWPFSIVTLLLEGSFIGGKERNKGDQYSGPQYQMDQPQVYSKTQNQPYREDKGMRPNYPSYTQQMKHQETQQTYQRNQQRGQENRSQYHQMRDQGHDYRPQGANFEPRTQNRRQRQHPH